MNELDYIARMLCTIQAEMVELSKIDQGLYDRVREYNKDFLDSMENFEKLRGRR